MVLEVMPATKMRNFFECDDYIKEYLADNSGHFVLIDELIQQGNYRPSALKLAKKMLLSPEAVIISPSKAKAFAFIEKRLFEARKSFSREALELMTAMEVGDKGVILEKFLKFCKN